MTLMLQRTTRVLFLAFMFASFLGVSWAHFEAQDKTTHVYKKEDASQQHEHCPSEAIHHCCHLNVFLDSDPIGLVVVPSVDHVFFDFAQNLKPFPFLEGPFQPPRI